MADWQPSMGKCPQRWHVCVWREWYFENHRNPDTPDGYPLQYTGRKIPHRWHVDMHCGESHGFNEQHICLGTGRTFKAAMRVARARLVQWTTGMDAVPPVEGRHTL